MVLFHFISILQLVEHITPLLTLWALSLRVLVNSSHNSLSLSKEEEKMKRTVSISHLICYFTSQMLPHGQMTDDHFHIIGLSLDIKGGAKVGL